MSAGDQYYEDLFKIEFLYSGERNTAATIQYASCAAAHGATIDELASLASAIGDGWGEQIMPLVQESIIFTYCTVFDWTSAEGLSYTETEGAAGGLTGAILPDQVCSLVTGEATTRYRGGHARWYIPAPEQSKLETGDTWEGSFVTDLQAAATAYVDVVNDQTIGDAALTLVLYHRAGNKVVEQGFEAIESVTAQVGPATQRRRVRRAGHLR